MSMSELGATDDLWIYDRFKVDEIIGTSRQIVDEESGLLWGALYKDSQRSKALPYGMANLIVMRAYAEVVQPRPAGNIHAAQRCELNVVPSLSRELRGDVFCVAKYIKRQRKIVEFRVDLFDVESEQLLCKSTLTICWTR